MVPEQHVQDLFNRPTANKFILPIRIPIGRWMPSQGSFGTQLQCSWMCNRSVRIFIRLYSNRRLVFETTEIMTPMTTVGRATFAFLFDRRDFCEFIDEIRPISMSTSTGGAGAAISRSNFSNFTLLIRLVDEISAGDLAVIAAPLQPHGSAACEQLSLIRVNS